MFEIKNVHALLIVDTLSIAGEKSGNDEESLKEGALLSDGENVYEVTGRPFVNYKTVKDMRTRISLTIKKDGVDVDKLQGKTLRLM